MAKDKAQVNQEEIQFLQRLRSHPELFERLQEILQITENSGAPLRTADEVEALLVEEIRRLGKTTMESWARHAESQVADEAKKQSPPLYCGKKKR